MFCWVPAHEMHCRKEMKLPVPLGKGEDKALSRRKEICQRRGRKTRVITAIEREAESCFNKSQ